MAANRPMVNVYEDGELVHRPMNDDEYAVWQQDVKDGLALRRAQKQAEIKGALAATDWWVARHLEDGATLTEERKAYRQQLRKLHAKTGKSKKPETIVLPDPPAAAS